MAPPDHAKKPAKPKPFSLSSFPLSDVPSAEDYENQLAAVTDDDGNVLCLAFSTGTGWFTVTVAGPLAIPDPAVPESPPPPPDDSATT